jgi:hypothetical protein
MRITDEYKVFCDGENIGYYYVFSDGSVEFTATYSPDKKEAAAMKKAGFEKDIKQKKPVERLACFMDDEHRVKDRKRIIYTDETITVERIPQETGEKFWIFRQWAEKGEEGYSEKKYSAPHYEGEKTPEGMSEWAQHYCFNKMDDGTYEAELDEAWWWGGGHNDGGTIHNEIPEEWFTLPYDEFLERVITLSAAAHYGFTADELKKKKGLKEFFGY